jgi:hypothetical protein
MNKAARRSDRRVRRVARPVRFLREAALIALLLAPVSTAAALASPFRRVAPSAVAFASDGARYAAWQVTKGAPIVMLDTRSGKRKSYPGCSIESEEERSAGQVAAAGRFLVRCGESTSLLAAATGAKTQLPQPPYGEWRAIGTRYVEGIAIHQACTHSASEEQKAARGGSELTCIALYDIATGALSYRPESDVPELDRVGAPVVCSAFRAKLLVDGRFDPDPGGFAFGEEMLAETVHHGEAPVKRIRVKHCDGRSRVISTEPRGLFLVGGLLTWDTGHAGDDVNAQAEGGDTHHGRLWTYHTATHARRSLPLPQTTIIGSRRVHGVFGYSSHAGKTLFWIAAKKVNAGKGVTVETSAVYAAKL